MSTDRVGGSGIVRRHKSSHATGGTDALTPADIGAAATDDVIVKALVNAKGDLITATANDTPAILSVGTNGHVLTADSAATNGIKWAAVPGGGKILQVIMANDTSSTNAGASYADTGLSATITPSSTSSKILVLVNLSYRLIMTTATHSPGAYTQLLRGSTVIDGNYLDMYGHVTTSSTSAYYLYWTLGYNYLDSPSTTSSTTYKIQHKLYNGTATNTGERNTMILMEVGP